MICKCTGHTRLSHIALYTVRHAGVKLCICMCVHMFFTVCNLHVTHMLDACVTHVALNFPLVCTIWMNVCMYACLIRMHVSMYVSTYVCMFASTIPLKCSVAHARHIFARYALA